MNKEIYDNEGREVDDLLIEGSVVDKIRSVQDKYDMSDENYCHWLAFMKANILVEEGMNERGVDFVEKGNYDSRFYADYISEVGGDMTHHLRKLKRQFPEQKNRGTYCIFGVEGKEVK